MQNRVKCAPGNGGPEVSSTGLQTQQQWGLVSIHLFNGTHGFEPYRIERIHERIHQSSKHIEPAKIRALWQSQNAIGSQRTCRIFNFAPDRLHLHMRRSTDVGRRFAVIHRGQRLDNGRLSPAFRICLDGIFEKSRICGQQIRNQLRGVNLPGGPCGFRNHQACTIGQSLSKNGDEFWNPDSPCAAA